LYCCERGIHFDTGKSMTAHEYNDFCNA
jgi:hypothetical protein